MYIVSILVSLAGAHVICSRGLVLKPQGEPGTKPAHNAHFLIPG